MSTNSRDVLGSALFRYVVVNGTRAGLPESVASETATRKYPRYHARLSVWTATVSA